MRKRPLLVWVAALLYVGAPVWGLLIMYPPLIKLSINNSFGVVFGTLPLSDFILLNLGIVLTLCAGISLFLLKRAAVNLIGIAVIFGIGVDFYRMFSVATIFPDESLSKMAIGWAIGIGVYMYARHLEKRGVLG